MTSTNLSLPVILDVIVRGNYVKVLTNALFDLNITMEMLRVENIVKQFSGHTALDNISITTKKGEIFGLLGPNGAGKTSLIRIINQITGPDSGKVYLEGREITRKDISIIGYLPEERGLYKKMGDGEQAMYLAQLKGLKKEDAKELLKAWFKKIVLKNKTRLIFFINF